MTDTPALNHGVFWWSIKVVCGATLIASLFLMTIYQLTTLFEMPVLVGQVLVISGVATSIYHYGLLKRAGDIISRPQTLVNRQGLYRWIRHPMYAADMVAYLGLFLIMPNIITVFVLVLGWVALARQSQIEDDYLADRFGAEFYDWREQSRLLIPAIY